MNKSEYQEEYCGQKGKGKGGAGGGGGAGGAGEGLTPCKHNEDVQPVGGRVQAKYREQMIEKMHAKKQLELDEAAAPFPHAKQEPFPSTAYDGDYARGEAGAAGDQRVQPKWRDANAPPSAGTQASSANPATRAEGDFKKRRQTHVYQTTQDNAPRPSPCPVMTVPEVHKLRYMHNNYMTGDDWYNN